MHRFTYPHAQDDTFSTGPGSYGDVVAVSQALRENMVAEGRSTNACFLSILSILSPLQLVRALCGICPHDCHQPPAPGTLQQESRQNLCLCTTTPGEHPGDGALLRCSGGMPMAMTLCTRWSECTGVPQHCMLDATWTHSRASPVQTEPRDS